LEQLAFATLGQRGQFGSIKIARDAGAIRQSTKLAVKASKATLGVAKAGSDYSAEVELALAWKAQHGTCGSGARHNRSVAMGAIQALPLPTSPIGGTEPCARRPSDD